MIQATLRSPATDVKASSTVAAVAKPATQAAPRAAAPLPPRPAAVPSRAPVGVITPRGAVASAPAPAAPAAPRVAVAPRLVAARPAPAAVVAPPVPPAPTTPIPAVAAPATPAAAPKTRKPRTPAAPKAPAAPVEVIQAAVETPDPEVQVDTTTTIAGGVDAELFGAEQPIIEVESEVLPAENPAGAAAPEEPYPTDPNEQVAEPTTAALTVRPPNGFAVARQPIGDADNGLEGDWGNEDLRFPQLKVVQGSGQLSAQWDNGTVIFADNLLFSPASVNPGAVNPLLYFVPLSVKKQWRENLTKEQQTEGLQPRVVDTVEEVESLGGSTLWIGNQKPGWSPSARCLFLLELPADVDHPNFTIDLDGRAYAVAVYYAGGTAFNTAAKVIFNTGLTSLQVPVAGEDGQPQKDPQGRVVKKTMLYKNYWTIQWVKKQSGDFMVWQPQVRILAKEPTGPEVRQYIENLLQSRQSFAVAAEEP